MKLIWYVDDHAEFRNSLHLDLEAKLPGCAVRTFVTGEQMLATLDSSDVLPFVIIADELMEGISGFGLFKMLCDRGIDVPFIIVSTDETAIQRFAATGVTALPKPDNVKFNTCDFVARLGSIMDVMEIRKEIKETITPLQQDMSEIKEWIKETRSVDVLKQISNFMDNCSKQPLLKFLVVPLLLISVSIIAGFFKAKGWLK